ncbi:hypothetical protein EV128_13168 [Rhizobium azibense]|nr:hypothetical protein EV128_13168 [Rhizobium azibense]
MTARLSEFAVAAHHELPQDLLHLSERCKSINFSSDGFRFGKQVAIFNAMHDKKLAGQFRQRLISRYSLQQRFEPTHASGRDDAEFHGKSANGIGELRPITD